MADERAVRRSSKVRVAEFLAAKGEGKVFKKLELFEGVPGVAQVDRRMRDLRELGWQIDNYKTDPHLQPDEYRLTAIGTRIDLGEQPDRPSRPRISATRRREAIEAADSLCQMCGTRAGEAFADGNDEKAALGVHIIDPSPPIDTELSNLRVECQRCSRGSGTGKPLPTREEILEQASNLSSRAEKRRLYRLMQSGQRERDEAERVFVQWLRLKHDDRVDVMLKLAGALIEED
ncbi:hypothetical protein [Streptomyces coeruleorubidus]|uniref:HNH endonuclease n=1 Tax=Streptomyces coeruleorubidus TaxID=116188 RepID=A0ABZ0KFG2_STRC4|nr:hypothetical protein [Streptomyces coeruleorubidus]WOT36620.1 hypothetical protein R5U08_21945 [Streptomyces coeruleorubidus]